MSARRVGSLATCHCGDKPMDGVIAATEARAGQPEGRALYVTLLGAEEPHLCLRATVPKDGGARAGSGRPATHLPRAPITPAIRAAAARAELSPAAWAERLLADASSAEPCWICGSWARCPCEGPPAYRPEPE